MNQPTTTYRIANLQLTDDEVGYNVHDYFDVSRIEDRHFASSAAAEEFAQTHYEGTDEDDIGVTWEIVEDRKIWALTDESQEVIGWATAEQVEESTNASAEVWIEVEGKRVFAA